LTENDFASFFYQRFGKTVVVLITKGASRAEAEDAAQEAMLQAWRHWDDIKYPVTWVRNVAIRVYLDQVGTRPQTIPLDESASETVAEPGLSVFVEEQQQVIHALRALPPEQRTVVALFYDGATCEEIAEATGKSPARSARTSGTPAGR
jgi:RNA polymerase sigma-70 factor (ECF subfamily)